MISTVSKVELRTRQTLFVVRCSSSSASKKVIDEEGEKPSQDNKVMTGLGFCSYYYDGTSSLSEAFSGRDKMLLKKEEIKK